MTDVRVAILGLGRIASLLEDDPLREKPASHAGAFLSVPGVRLVGGWDPLADRRAAFTSRWQTPTDFGGPTDLIRSVGPDVVVVATPPDSHRELTRTAAHLGVPVVVCEKPVTTDLAEANQLLREIASTGTRVMVNHERRYARDYSRVRDLIVNRTFGDLRSVNAKLFMGRGRAPGEVLLWDGTHLFDILRFLTGAQVGSVRAWGEAEKSGGRLTARMLLGHTEAIVETAADRDHLLFELDLSFERGRVRIGNGLYEEGIGGPSPLYEKMRSLLPVAVETTTLYPTKYFSGMAADAVRAVREPGYQPVSSLEDGVAALAVVEKVLKAAGSGLRRIAQLTSMSS